MNTIADLFETVYRTRWKTLKTAKEYRRLWENYIRPRLDASRSVAEFEYEDVVAFHRKGKNTPYQANRALALLSTMFSMAERPLRWRAPQTSPTYGVRPYPERKRKRLVKGPEFPALKAALDRHAQADPEGVAAIWLVLYTGARPTEITGAKREWLDGNVLRLPDSKVGQREIYLPPQALAVLDNVHPNDGSLVGRRYPKRLWQQVRRDIGATDLWLRDLRRTFATVGMQATGNQGMIGELLGHKELQTTKTYALLIEDSAKAAVATIADSIDRLTSGQTPPALEAPPSQPSGQ